MDRRRFLRTLAGAAVAAALPSSLVLPLMEIPVRCADLDADFAGSLYGLLTNARRSAFVVQSVSFSEDFRMSFWLDQREGR